jgi:hypothetical protein
MFLENVCTPVLKVTGLRQHSAVNVYLHYLSYKINLAFWNRRRKWWPLFVPFWAVRCNTTCRCTALTNRLVICIHGLLQNNDIFWESKPKSFQQRHFMTKAWPCTFVEIIGNLSTYVFWMTACIKSKIRIYIYSSFLGYNFYHSIPRNTYICFICFVSS